VITPEHRGRSAHVCLIFVLLLAVLPASTADKHSEKPYALIFGTIYGPDKRPAYGIRVRIRRADHKNPQWELFSDHQGEFAQRVPAGSADYIVAAEAAGKHMPTTEVTAHVQNDERVDIGLHLK
jgi:hypothetical protein